MTGSDAIAYIHSFGWEQHAPGLVRIRQLLRLLGDPQKHLKFVHVAGTNGKGSVCALLAAVLQAAGYQVGLNTSPHLTAFSERIQVNGAPISDEELGALTEQAKAAADSMAEHPTEFELITAIALLHFRARQCDLVILEAGLGGALDASNVIDTPELAVLTAMGLDHTAQLGPTLADIAAAKAGILKAGGRAASLGTCPEADAVFRRACLERGAELTEVDFSRLALRRQTPEGAEFDFAPRAGLRISLAGSYQLQNAALAITALECLEQRGWHVSPQALREGLAAAHWPGRFEILRRSPTVILDGAHNAHGMTAAMESLRTLFPGRKTRFLLGILADKDVDAMLDQLAPLAEEVYALRPDSPRALKPEILCALLANRGVPARPWASAEAAASAALAAAGTKGVVCALGSLYLYGEVRRALSRQ